MPNVSLAGLRPTVTTAEYIELLDIADDADITVIVKGPPGCGKTSVAKQKALARKQEARERGERYGYAELNLANANLLDIMGHLAVMDREVEGIKFKAGEYTYPYAWFDLIDGAPAFLYPRGLFVIEEWGQGGDDEKRAMGSFMLERRIGRWKLPDGWRIVLLTNRDTDRSGVGADYDFLINRRIEVELKPDLETWLGWANDNHMSYYTKAFVSLNQEKILNAEVPEEQGPFVTLRSMELADRTIAAFQRAGKGFEHPLLLKAVAGLIGMDWAAKLKEYHAMGHTLPKWSQVQNDPLGTHVPAKADQQYLVTHQLAAKVGRDSIDAVFAYMQRFPKMFLLTFAATAKKLHPEIVNTVAFGDFQRKHLDLIAAAAA